MVLHVSLELKLKESNVGYTKCVNDTDPKQWVPIKTRFKIDLGLKQPATVWSQQNTRPQSKSGNLLALNLQLVLINSKLVRALVKLRLDEDTPQTIVKTARAVTMLPRNLFLCDS